MYAFQLYEDQIRHQERINRVMPEVFRRLALEFSNSTQFQLQSGQLFHYTNYKALINILKSKKFWVSESRYLNDKFELIHTKELIQEILVEKNLERIPKWNALPKALDICYEQMKFYILSMTLEPNCQELWKRYGDVNIGFDIDKLQKVWNQRLYLFDHRGVIYNDSEKHKFLSTEIDLLRESESEFGETYNDEFATRLFLVFSKLLINSNYLKNESLWSAEKEYRVVFAGVRGHFLIPIRTHTNPSNNKPFIEIDWFIPNLESPIQCVTLSSECKGDKQEITEYARIFDFDIRNQC